MKRSEAIRVVVSGLLLTGVVVCIIAGVAITIVRVALNAVGV